MKNENKLNFIVGINSFVVVSLVLFMIILASNVISTAADNGVVDILGVIQLSRFGVAAVFVLGSSLIGFQTYQIIKSIAKSKTKKEAEKRQYERDEFELLKKQIAKVQMLANKASIE